jgi:hypothetical protein
MTASIQSNKLNHQKIANKEIYYRDLTLHNDASWSNSLHETGPSVFDGEV